MTQTSKSLPALPMFPQSILIGDNLTNISGKVTAVEDTREGRKVTTQFGIIITFPWNHKVMVIPGSL